MATEGTGKVGDKAMAYDLTGKIKLIQDAQTFGSGFTKREMVVTVEDGKYPQDINLEFVQDKVGLLDSLSVGDDVTVTFDIRGREYSGRYFNNLQAWKVNKNTATSAPPAEAPSDDGFDDEKIPF
jgi:hypothetical protein